MNSILQNQNMLNQILLCSFKVMVGTADKPVCCPLGLSGRILTSTQLIVTDAYHTNHMNLECP